jgi:ubiquinone/menaquinone biosynthesis C-methylase UbiE
MHTRAARLEADSLGRLHRDLIEDGVRIREILERLKRDRIEVKRGLTRGIDREKGHVGHVEDDRILLDMTHFDSDREGQSFFSFELDGAPYFFEGVPLGRDDAAADGLPFQMPRDLYAAERRGFSRRRFDTADADDSGAEAPRKVELETSEGTCVPGDVLDWSYDGLAVSVSENAESELASEVKVRFLDGPSAGDLAFGEVRHIERSEQGGWVRLGMAVSRTRVQKKVPVDRRDRLDRGKLDRWMSGLAKLGAVGRLSARKALGRKLPSDLHLPIERYEDESGQELVAYVDIVGDPKGAPAVVISPGWGKTKETLLPLAETLLETFRRAGQPIVVVRFDGIRRRGESHNDPQCRAKGREAQNFTLSQCVRDVQVTLDHLEETYDTRRAVLVSFSASAVEGRRVVSTDSRIVGWVSVVGAADLQSALRIVTGGVDYPYGYQQGVKFGLQEILGVEVDMDNVLSDGLEHRLWYQEDARQDMAAVKVPVTWIHGRDDAWMDLERVRELLSVGDASQRHLIEVPMGHQMRTSDMALDTFRLIASEVGSMVLDHRPKSRGPDLVALETRRLAERARLGRAAPDLHEFWQDYLLGRDRSFGIDLMAAMSPYEAMMALQVARLELGPGDCVADLGAGTGALVSHLTTKTEVPEKLRILALDFVSDALRRAGERAQSLAATGGDMRSIRCNLAVDAAKQVIPLADESVDAVLASLLISYLPKPEAVVQEAFRVLRPGGRLVLSSLRRDADTSRLYTRGVEELKAGRGRELLGEQTPEQVAAATRSFLNDAARLLDLEEEGVFHFYDEDELVEMVRASGFSQTVAEPTFGDPAQAVVVSAIR